jgi:phenolic acid decarboxylase
MAYVNQEKKAKILKKVMPKGWKYSLAVRNHSTIVCTIKSAPVDLNIGKWNKPFVVA